MRKYTKEILEPIIKESFFWADVCRKLKIKPSTGSQSYIKIVSVGFGLEFSHFKGKGWNKGKIFEKKKPISFYLVNNGRKIDGTRIRKRLVSEGLKEEHCEICNITDWMGKKAPLELDHINGNHEDNRLENLRILCCNCHAQTDTYCSKNRKSKSIK